MSVATAVATPLTDERGPADASLPYTMQCLVP